MEEATNKAKIDPEGLYKKIGEVSANFCSNANLYLTKGNKAAGTRSRTASKELGKLLKEWRKVTVKGDSNA